MAKSDLIKWQQSLLKMQLENLKRRYERQLLRDEFVKKHKAKLLKLSMEGWPRLKYMKDRMKWMEFVYLAKIQGLYSIGTSNCDVIAQLDRFAKENSK